jgi:hypothetical protein
MKTIHILACSIALASVLGAQTGGRSSVEGQVVSGADGTPVRRAAVSLQRTFSSGAALPGQPPRTQLPQPQTETDDQGHFAFHDLEPGGYQVTVQRQGFVAQNGMAIGGPNVQLWLGEGQQLTGYVVRATPQAVIAGKVVDEYGDPVMGAQVYAQRAGSATGRPVMNGGNVQSNDLGEYRIAGLSAGDYLVATAYLNQNRAIMTGSRQPSPGQPQLVYATTYHPGTAVAGAAAPVHVADGAVIGGIDIKLTKIAAYSVHVTVADAGAPPNGPSAFPNLRMRDPSAVLGGGFFGPQRQQDGSFLFTGVPPGSYVLTAQRNSAGAPGSAVSASMPIEVRDQNLEGIALEVKPNADLQGAVRYAQPGECNATNMQVSLRPPGWPGVVMYGPMPQPATVGDDLRFTLKGVVPGGYAVNVMGNTGRCYVKSILYRGQTAPEGALTVSESGSLDITLAPYSAMLSVVVVDRDGNPAPRARIMAVPKEGGAGMNGVNGMNGMAGSAGQTTFA